MIPMRLSFFVLCAALFGCGGPSASAGAGSAGSSSAGGESRTGRDDADRDHETADGEDAAREEFPLEARARVPGTGVSLRAPRGSDPMPTGSGFVHARRRIQIIVAEVSGPDEILDAFRRTLTTEGMPEVDNERISISGHDGTLGIDRTETGDVEIERVWVVVREGDRAMAVVGAYLAERSERYRGLVRAAVTSAEWDPSVPIDAEQAMGFAMEVEGLVLDRSATSPVTYVPEGASIPPSPSEPRLFLLALPVAIPPADRDDVCEQLLLQAGPVDEDHVATRGEIETDDLGGCEVTGLVRPGEEADDDTEVSAYSAVVYHDDGIFLVAGLGGSTDGRRWMTRFAEAARSLHRVRE